MNKFRSAFLLAIGLSLAGCNSIPSWLGGGSANTPSTVATTARQIAEKSLTASYATHTAFANQLVYDAQNHLIAGGAASTAKGVLDKTKTILDQAKADYDANKDIAAELADAGAQLWSAFSLIPGAPVPTVPKPTAPAASQ